MKTALDADPLTQLRAFAASGVLDRAACERSVRLNDIWEVAHTLEPPLAPEPCLDGGSLTVVLLGGPHHAMDDVAQRWRRGGAPASRSLELPPTTPGTAARVLVPPHGDGALLLASVHPPGFDRLGAFLGSAASEMPPQGVALSTGARSVRQRADVEARGGLARPLIAACWKANITLDQWFAAAAARALRHTLPAVPVTVHGRIECTRPFLLELPPQLDPPRSLDSVMQVLRGATIELGAAPSRQESVASCVASNRGLEVSGLRVLDWMVFDARAMLNLCVLVQRDRVHVRAEASGDRLTQRALQETLEALLEPLMVLDPSASREPAMRSSELHSPEPRRAAAGGDAAPSPRGEPAANAGAAFLRAAAQHADRVAIVHERGQVTFKGLALAARRAAAVLAERGVGLGDRVVVALDRSVEAIVAMLATHQLGASYVAVAPNAPRERLRVILEELGARCFVAPHGFAAVALLGELGVPTVLADGLEASRQPLSRADYASGHVAYVLHTSGSTGTPKAAANSHAGLMHRLEWMRRELELGCADVIVQKTPYVFDVSVWEVFLPLLTGARMLLAKPGGHMDPWYLGSLLDRGATCMHFVPSMLRAFLAAAVVPKAPWRLRHLVCSGEALDADLVHSARSAFPGAELHNYYGPTEASIDVTRWRVDSRAIAPPLRVPIGSAAPGVQAVVLDDAAQPCAPGSTGELCIAGVQLAHGYLNSASATAAKFLPNPYAEVPGERMYATGDYAAERPDGELDFFGRKDGQVKIRGMRVELEEIEREVRLRCAVEHCMAVADEHRVYLLLPPHELTRFGAERLAQHLPEHMIPRSVVLATELPLTASGKLDRKKGLELARASSNGHARSTQG